MNSARQLTLTRDAGAALQTQLHMLRPLTQLSELTDRERSERRLQYNKLLKDYESIKYELNQLITLAGENGIHIASEDEDDSGGSGGGGGGSGAANRSLDRDLEGLQRLQNPQPTTKPPPSAAQTGGPGRAADAAPVSGSGRSKLSAAEKAAIIAASAESESDRKARVAAKLAAQAKQQERAALVAAVSGSASVMAATAVTAPPTAAATTSTPVVPAPKSSAARKPNSSLDAKSKSGAATTTSEPAPSPQSSQTQSQVQVLVPNLRMETEADVNMAIAKERAVAIKRVTGETVAAREMFRQLAEMVEDQDAPLALLADHVITAHDDAVDADRALTAADKRQTGSRNMLCWMILCLIIVVLVVFTVLVVFIK